MNPRTLDPIESQTLYDLHHAYQDTWDRMVSASTPALLAQFVRAVGELAEHYRMSSGRENGVAP